MSTPKIGVIGAPTVARALESLGFHVIFGDDFREVATQISNTLVDGAFPVIVADDTNPILAPWVQVTLTKTERLIVLGTQPGSGLFAGDDRHRLELPATFNDLLTKLGYQTTPADIGSEVIGTDATLGAPHVQTVEALPEAPPETAVTVEEPIEAEVATEPETAELVDESPSFAADGSPMITPSPQHAPAVDVPQFEQVQVAEPVTVAEPEPVSQPEPSPVSQPEPSPAVPLLPANTEDAPDLDTELDQATPVQVPGFSMGADGSPVFDAIVEDPLPATEFLSEPQQVEEVQPPVAATPIFETPVAVAVPPQAPTVTEQPAVAYAPEAPVVAVPEQEPMETGAELHVAEDIAPEPMADAPTTGVPAAVEFPIPVAQPIYVSPVAEQVEMPAPVQPTVQQVPPATPVMAQREETQFPTPTPEVQPERRRMIFSGQQGQLLISAAGKGGVGKTSSAITLAAIASQHMKVILIDANRGQADIRKYLRIGDSPLPTAYDAFTTSDPSKAVLMPPDYAHLRRAAKLDVPDFGVVLGPPSDLAGGRYASASVYGDIIDYARSIADLVIVDTQIMEAPAERTDIWSNTLIPLLNGDAWLLGITDESSAGVDNLFERLTELRREGTNPARTLVLCSQFLEFGPEDIVYFQQKFAGIGALIGSTGVDDDFHTMMSAGRILSDSAAIRPALDAVLLHVTGRDDLYTPKPAHAGEKNKKRSGFFKKREA